MLAIIIEGFTHTVAEVALALAPLAGLFLIAQLWFRRTGQADLLRLLRGLVLAFIGLALFLQGVYVGFLPTGEQIGLKLGSSPLPWLLVPMGFLLGLVATLAEPAVAILNHQVELASGGYIGRRVMLITVALGVALAVALAMLRVLCGFPLWYILLPGYALALWLSYHVRAEFTAIAFDSGGVATGPMTVTFILAVSIGAATVIPGRDPLREGFGLIALVALAPIISVLALGLLYSAAEGQLRTDTRRR
ncbi:MAG: DUF1538 domain-containing protein [Bacillota bacterium]|nr:DUF1538 domain-containing protein [Bacillota bacterium]